MSVFVDANAHLTAPLRDREKYPVSPFPGANGSIYVTSEASVEEYVELIDRAGIEQALLIGSRNHGFVNDYCLDSALRYPDRFVGIACVDAYEPDVINQINYWVGERGAQGLRIFGGGPSNATWQDDPAFTPMWKRVMELDVAVNAQQTNAPELPKARNLLQQFPEMRTTMTNFSHVSVVDGPDGPEATDLWSLVEFPNVYVNLAIDWLERALVENSAEEIMLRALVDVYSAKRITWSPMYPALYPMPPTKDSVAYTFERTVEIVKGAFAFLSEEDREWAYGEAARNLYPSLRP